MSMVSEFKEFIARGNVIDLAVAVVIAGAFGKIVTALVNGVVMPFIGHLTGGASVSEWKYVLSPATVDAAGAEVAEVAEVAIQYGAFIQTIIDFLLIAFVIFLFIKAYNRMKKAEEAEPEAPAEPAEDVLLLREIRDSLKK